MTKEDEARLALIRVRSDNYGYLSHEQGAFLLRLLDESRAECRRLRVRLDALTEAVTSEGAAMQGQPPSYRVCYATGPGDVFCRLTLGHGGAHDTCPGSDDTGGVHWLDKPAPAAPVRAWRGEAVSEEVGVAVNCMVCGMRKCPRGRSAPMEMANGLCSWDCAGYDKDPRPGDLWPGETRSEFDYGGGK